MPPFPKNGLLSGMIVTGLAAVLAIALGILVPASHASFDAPSLAAPADGGLWMLPLSQRSVTTTAHTVLLHRSEG